jgi:hypothetical protein
VENKAVETNPANSNLAADDMSAMKYVSPFFFSFCFFYKNSAAFFMGIEHFVPLTA